MFDNSKNYTMETVEKILYHYSIGVLISASIIILLMIFDLCFTSYLIYPQLDNFIRTCLLGGIGFGLTHFSITNFQRHKKNNTNLKN